MKLNEVDKDILFTQDMLKQKITASEFKIERCEERCLQVKENQQF